MCASVVSCSQFHLNQYLTYLEPVRFVGCTLCDVQLGCVQYNGDQYNRTQDNTQKDNLTQLDDNENHSQLQGINN